MDYRRKRNILLVILGVLIIINLSAIITFSYNKYYRNEQIRQEHLRYGKDPGNHYQRIMGYVRKELELSDNQFDKYGVLIDEHRKHAKEIAERMHTTKLEIINEINKEKPDTILLTQLSDSIGLQNKLMQIELNNHFFEFKKILNPKQLQKFENLLLRIEKKDWERKRKRHGRAGMDSMKRRYRGHQK